MKTVVFFPLTQEDVRDIWDYTLNHWGIKQSTLYVQNLRDASYALATGNAIGRVATIGDGYFNYRSDEHFIFYRETDIEISIIRILHKSMDIGRYL